MPPRLLSSTAIVVNSQSRSGAGDLVHWQAAVFTDMWLVSEYRDTRHAVIRIKVKLNYL